MASSVFRYEDVERLQQVVLTIVDQSEYVPRRLVGCLIAATKRTCLLTHIR